ncbi:protein kinase domain-containing protein [Candidatus Uabimicrobium amorphum]|uniref:non-specific serine/threonine protein kinase n=1 Tax=Uabimicrobium amorphum TaxID=2596890 RepID=A0A5S9IP52_UABAM|nr:protein kinase [Candidatus Uabimicrobium amorphum]BBM85120.1 protein kinase [Candidatus Uabimicrobium amorphum]
MLFSSYEQALVKLLVQKNWVQPHVINKVLEYVTKQRQQGQKIAVESVLLQSGYVSQQNLQTAIGMVSTIMSSGTASEVNVSQQSMMNSSKFTQTQMLQAINQRQVIAHYNIEKELGRGGMGIVFKATDTKLGRTVAVKVIIGTALTATKIRRFLEEAKATARLKHPHIISLYEINNTPVNYFTMEYVEGKPLSDYVGKGLKLKEVLYIMNKCASAIDFAHKEGIIHRDIKPSNIMLDKLKNPKVMDFGLAKDVNNDQNLSRQGDVMGTPAYMSPEQADGRKVDPRSDVYSLGATMYQMLVGRAPFQADSYWKVLKKLHTDDPIRLRVLNPDIPPEVEAICLKCLEKSPRKRYRTAEAFAKDIENFLKDRPVSASPITPISRMFKLFKRNKLISSLVLFIVMITVFSGVSIFYQYFQLQDKNEKLGTSLSELAKVNNDLEIARQKAEEAKNEAITQKQEALDARNEAVTAKQKAQIREYYANILLTNQYLKDHNSLEAQEALGHCAKDLRNWEWYWLDGQCNTSEPQPEVIREFAKKATSIGLHRDLLAMGNKKGQVIIYHMSDRRIIKKLNKTKKSSSGIPGTINDCIFSPSGKYLAILHGQFVEVFSTTSWDLVAAIPHENVSRTCLFLSQEHYLAVGYEVENYDIYKRKIASKKRKQGVVIWNIKTQKPLKIFSPLNEFENNINSLAYRNGKLFCGVGDNERIRKDFNKDFLTIWDLKTERVSYLSKSRIYPKSKIHSIIVDKFIITASFDGTIIIYNKKLQPLRQLVGHKSYVFSCCLSPDKKYLVSTSNDNTMIVWSMETFERVATLVGHVGAVYKCAFYGKDQLVSCGKDGVKFWRIRYSDAHFSGNNPFIFPKQKYAITDCAIDLRTPNQLAFALEHALSIFLSDFRGVKIELPEKNRLKPFLGSMGPVRYLQFHPNKNMIVNGSDFGEVLLWDMQNGQKVRKYSGHKITKHIRHCVFNHDGSRIASASYDSTIRIWNSDIDDFAPKTQGNSLFVLQGFKGDLNAACFQPNGNLIVAGGQPGLKMWNIDEGQLQGKKNVKLSPIKSGLKLAREVFYCEYTPDGKYIIASSKGAKDNLLVADSKTLKLVHTFEGHSDRVEIFSFIPNYPNRLASASFDGTIRIWNLDNIEKSKKSRAVLTIEVSNQQLKTLCFNHDGSLMVSGGFDRHIRIWRFHR